jgi:hypothetical protein
MQEGGSAGAFKEIDRVQARYAIEVGKPLLVRCLGSLVWLTSPSFFCAFSIVPISQNGLFVDKRLVARIGNNAQVHAEASRASAASSLVIGGTSVFQNTEGTYDFYAPVENDNEQWAAIITYAFETGDGETEPAKLTCK